MAAHHRFAYRKTLIESKKQGLPTILPTTKPVVGNGHLQTDLDGKNKKALYLQANNRAFKTFLDG